MTMRKFNLILLLLVVQAFVGLASASSAQLYWFQTGARASNQAAQNNGTSVYIETVEPQTITYGSMAFWVGEDLSNGAFVQEGYEISNQSGYYPTNCTLAGCSSRVFLSAGTPAWFWEYFPSGYSGDKFLGGIGQNGSAGENGEYNNYTLYSNGDVWNFLFNGDKIGSVDLGASSSGSYPPTAFAEYAGALDNMTYMNPVVFENLSFIRNGALIMVPEAYSYKGYGKGSSTTLANPYNISEVEPYSNRFIVGSGIKNGGQLLWNNSAALDIESRFANISSIKFYSLYSEVAINAPKFYYINNTARAVFQGWKGAGYGSYTGNSTSFGFSILGNVTEEALWRVQYFVNASSEYGNATGSGWYYNGSVANISIPSTYGFGNYTRAVFQGWNGVGYGSYTGNSTSFSLKASAPIVEKPIWKVQYFVNASSEYGNATGSGWYYNGSVANISVGKYYLEGNGIAKEFDSWSGKYYKNDVSLNVASPIRLDAEFGNAYLVHLIALNGYNAPINVSIIEVNGKGYNSSPYLPAGDNLVQYAVYKGSEIGIEKTINVTGPSSFNFTLPVYNLSIYVRSYFDFPVSGDANLVFSNGTSHNFTINKSGTLNLENVPFGFVKGTIQHEGMRLTFNDSSGANIYLNIPGFTLYFVIAFGIAVVFTAYFVGRRFRA